MAEINLRFTSVEDLNNIVSRKIPVTCSGTQEYIVRKNILHNIQFLQFLSQIYNSNIATTVINVLLIKYSIVIISSIIEAVLSYELIKNNLIPMEEWEYLSEIKANPKIIKNMELKTITVLLKKSDQPKIKMISFKDKINKAQDKKILGKNPKVYQYLSELSKLRNKIHLHLIDDSKETDYQTFSYKKYVKANLFFFEFLKYYFNITKKEYMKYISLIDLSEQK